MPQDSEPADSPSRTHAAPPRRGGSVPLIALGIVGIVAVTALGAATWSLLKPVGGDEPGTAEPTYTDEQRAADKNKVCAAFATVRTGVGQNTNLQPPGGAGDITGALAVAANARLSLSDGGQYLLARVEPATPAELADAVRQFGNTLMDIGAAATAGALNSDPDQASRLRDADSANARVTALCAG